MLFRGRFERQLGSGFQLTAAFRVHMNHFLLGAEDYKWITFFEFDWQMGIDELFIFLFFLDHLSLLFVLAVDCVVASAVLPGVPDNGAALRNSGNHMKLSRFHTSQIEFF